jgi:hypothetical protein
MAKMVVRDGEWCFLEIGIPTYNRSRKLKRLLWILEQGTASIPLDLKIRVTVSDNRSSDAPQSILQEHSFRNKIVTRVNAENVGALCNTWGLYESTPADYA